MHCLNRLAWSRLLLGLVLINTSLSALAADPAWAGVWRGTIGKAPVSMCFNSDGGGSYYYFARDIQLSLAHKESGDWEEYLPNAEEPSGTLAMRLNGNFLRGYWHSPSSNRKAALNLHRVAFNPEDEPCYSSAFHQTRLTLQKIRVSAPKKFAGNSFRSLIARSVTGIEIVDPLNQSTTKINLLLRQSFDKNRLHLFQCIGNTQGMPTGEWNTNQTIQVWSNHWLVVTDIGDYWCGDAHPDNLYSATIYDLDKGQKLDIRRWFKPKFWNPEFHSIRVDSKLGKLVLKTLDPVEENAPFITQYSIWPSKKGMIFYPLVAHVMQASAEEILIPYPKLKPYLNAAGLKAVNELMQEYP